MKHLICVIVVLLSCSVAHAQNEGRITTKIIRPKAGVQNQYFYQPAKKMVTPEKILAAVTYQNRQQFFTKTITLNKAGSTYSFLFEAPDSTAVLVISIIVPGKVIPEKTSMVVERKTILDNNNENGFVIYLYDKNNKRFIYEKTELAVLLNDYAFYELFLKKVPTPSLLKLFEDSYRLYPQLQNENSYADYLSFLFNENESAAKPKLLWYANELIQQSPDEDKLELVVWAYRKLKMDEEKKMAEEKISTSFPNGKMAKEKYLSDLYTKLDSTEETLLKTLNAYIARFTDNTVKTKDRFFRTFIEKCIEHKDWATAFKYGNLITEKMNAAYSYNYHAWKLSGKEIEKPAVDLENAKILSAKSIAISTVLMNDRKERDEDALRDLKEAHYNFYDTYALILYKLGQYDSAFYYQDQVSRQGKELNTGGMEKYAAYAQKVKGTAFTKQFIESKLLAGNKSPVMLKQLQGIYKELNLPEDEFSRLQDKSMLLAKQKSDAAIKAMYGSLTAPDFSLKNMLGENVTLSQLKNKIVVLDFWATWCGPCKASFPTMQQLVDKYKDDKDVIFLFIDTWESAEPSKNLETVKKYITDNKYSFNVLFDVKKKVVKDYKIEEIPKKIVLDRNGNLVYTGGQSGLIFTNEHLLEEMNAIIDAAKKIPIDSDINKTKLPESLFLHPKAKQ